MSGVPETAVYRGQRNRETPSGRQTRQHRAARRAAERLVELEARRLAVLRVDHQHEWWLVRTSDQRNATLVVVVVERHMTSAGRAATVSRWGAWDTWVEAKGIDPALAALIEASV